MTLPPSVQAEVKRILDAEARRLLEEQLAAEQQRDRDTVGAAAGSDPHPPTEPTR